MYGRHIALRDAIEENILPDDYRKLFEGIVDSESNRFTGQESFVIDFKETCPRQFKDSYGAGIIRLALAFHNTFGGIIVFCVEDSRFSISGLDEFFDIESFNSALRDFAGLNIECICKEYYVETASAVIQAVVVPRRKMTRPAFLKQQLNKYAPGTCFVRDRHEALVAEYRHMALLYSPRERYFQESAAAQPYQIHRSFPPSPATLKNFIGRMSLAQNLWEWLLYENGPRMYLHGPGGAGKSTLAYEFAKSITMAGEPIKDISGNLFDYVIFISGKQTEMNPFTGHEQNFTLRQFSNKHEQFCEILSHAGMIDDADESHRDIDVAINNLKCLFDDFSGLIVIDDIDALSREQVDTGEEELFLLAAKARRPTKILYTLRYAPQHAIKSSVVVPGLNPSTEYHDFLTSCCHQFEVPLPSPEVSARIAEKTDCIPLLIETITGLRRSCSEYHTSLRMFDERGGEGARRYLYQREYDKLQARGKARLLLATLILLDHPISFSDLLRIISAPQEEIRDALAEVSSIFLSTSLSNNGATLYELSSPSVSFVRNVSVNLDYFSSVKRRVDAFQTNADKMPHREAAIVAQCDRLIRRKSYSDLIVLSKDYTSTDPIWQIPQFLALLGQAHSRNVPSNVTEARECFRAAHSKGYWDIFMMRQWFYIENSTGYGWDEAERVCDLVIASPETTPRHLSEFMGKKAIALANRGRRIIFSDRERALFYLNKAMLAGIEGVAVGRNVDEIDTPSSIEDLSRIYITICQYAGDELHHIFDIIEVTANLTVDIGVDVAELLYSPLGVLGEAHLARLRNRTRGLCNRTIGVLNKGTRRISIRPGFDLLMNKLQILQKIIEN